MECEADINDSVEASIEIEADSSEERVSLAEASIRFKNENDFRIKIGWLKKDFGLEKMQSLDELVTTSRSVLYEYIDALGYLSRDFTASFYQKEIELQNGREFSYFLNLSVNETYSLIFNPRLETELKNSRLGFSFIYQRILNWTMYGQNHFAAALDYVFEKDALSFDAEFLCGSDYLLGANYSNETAVFSALKSTVSAFLEREGTLTAFEPFFLAELFTQDVMHEADLITEFRLGVNLYLFDEDTRFQMDLGPVLNYSSTSVHPWTLGVETKVCGQLQTRW